MDSAPVDSSCLSRKELQTYLKAWHRRATGTTVALREAYEKAKLQNLSLTTTTVAAPDDVPVAASKPATPRVVGTAQNPALSSEKRLKRYRSTPSLAIRQRIDRARTQRLYLVQRSSNVERKTCKFAVLGSTGNVYDVSIAQMPHCSCPDHAKGNLCKHILFVMLKVIGLPSNSPLVYQDAYLQSELDEVIDLLNRRRVGGSVMANTNVQKTYASLQNGDCPESLEDTKRKSLDANSDCPICFDGMEAAGNSLTYCRAACGSNFHAECIRRWLGQNRHNPTCPNCRQTWQGDETKKSSTSPTREGYTNLGALQGQSTERDDASYSPWYNRSYKKRRHW